MAFFFFLPPPPMPMRTPTYAGGIEATRPGWATSKHRAQPVNPRYFEFAVADDAAMHIPRYQGVLLLLLLAFDLSFGVSLPTSSIAGPTLTSPDHTLVVVLDGVLPRPRTVLHVPSKTNLSAPAAPAPSPLNHSVDSGHPSEPEQRRSLCTAIRDVGCWGSTEGGPAEDKAVWGTGKNVPLVPSQAECCAMCTNHSACTAWTWNGK